MESPAINARIDSFKEKDRWFFDMISTDDGRKNLDKMMKEKFGEEALENLKRKPSQWARLYYQYNVIEGEPDVTYGRVLIRRCIISMSLINMYVG